ncbi:hypothetical protein ACTMTF_36700 [Nonomuraea sp. ZG12]|uniref:hypothetical protein n=1 Tax=Nonomuraea sp. ZG12 TaxID=3452207 RepID=UPI003F88E5E7
MSTWRETVWDQPDIPEDLEQRELEITTTYHVTVARTGKRWTATVDNLPDHHVVQVQGATWREAADNVIEDVSALVSHNSDSAGFHFTPADQDAADALNNVHSARAARLYAEQAERDAVRDAARVLADQGWTTRDLSSVLGLPQQRISHIIPAPPD